MACLNRLKSDIRILCETFPPTHSLFRVTSATVDEITCSFVVKKGSSQKKYSINANITENYPSDPPVWFSDSDDISGSVQVLATTEGNDNYVRKLFYFFHDFKTWVCFRFLVKLSYCLSTCAFNLKSVLQRRRWSRCETNGLIHILLSQLCSISDSTKVVSLVLWWAAIAAHKSAGCRSRMERMVIHRFPHQIPRPQAPSLL